MNKTILTVLFLVTLFPVFSQDAHQEWFLDLDQATEKAKEENKSVVLVFQGSDWCGPCKILDKKVWQTEEFKSYAKDNFIMVKADFPRKKKNRLSKEQQEKNNQLAESYNQNGFFPMVVVFDAEKKVMGKTGFKKMNASEYIKHLESFIN